MTTQQQREYKHRHDHLQKEIKNDTALRNKQYGSATQHGRFLLSSTIKDEEGKVDFEIERKRTQKDAVFEKVKKNREELLQCEKDNGALSNEYRLLSNKYRDHQDLKQDTLLVYEDFLETIDDIKPRIENLVQDNKQLKEKLAKLQKQVEKQQQMEESYQTVELVRKD